MGHGGSCPLPFMHARPGCCRPETVLAPLLAHKAPRRARIEYKTARAPETAADLVKRKGVYECACASSTGYQECTRVPRVYRLALLRFLFSPP